MAERAGSRSRDPDPDREQDDVGYRRPPPWGQFRPGQSGNPKGRPKGTGKKRMASRQPAQLTEFESLLRDMLDEEVPLTQGGRQISVSKRKAILLNLFKQAMAGNPSAIRELNRYTEKVEAKQEAMARAEAEAREQAARDRAEQDERLFRYHVDLKQKQARLWEAAIAAGKSEPDQPWPHPDDILIDHTARTGHIHGPSDAACVPFWEDMRDLRDHFLARMVLASDTADKATTGLLTRFWLMAMVREDLRLPKRWQIAHDLQPATFRLMSLPRRRLQQIVDEGITRFETPSTGSRLSRETYREMNTIYRPLIHLLGYRSLRQFQRAWEDNGGTLQVPKRIAGRGG